MRTGREPGLLVTGRELNIEVGEKSLVVLLMNIVDHNNYLDVISPHDLQLERSGEL